MGNKRYDIIKRVNHREWLEGAPIKIETSQLLFDTQKDRIILLIKMFNLSDKEIWGVNIDVNCFDEAMIPVVQLPDVLYYGVDVKPQSEFGERQPVILEETQITSVEIIIRKVVFADDTVWENDEKKQGIQLPEQKIIERKDPFCKHIVNAIRGTDINPYYWYEADADHWRCTCGQAHSVEAFKCSYCGLEKKWVEKYINREYLQTQENELKGAEDKQKREEARFEEELKKRLEEEKREEELKKHLEEERCEQERTENECRERLLEAQSDEEMKLLLEAGRSKIEFKNNLLKKVKMAVPIFLVLIVALFLNTTFIQPNIAYSKAMKLYQNENYQHAVKVFKNLNGYKDSKQKISHIINIYQASISAGLYHTVGLKADGFVVATGYNDISQCEVSDWRDIIAISAGGAHTVGVKADGTVVAVGDNGAGQCEVSEWSDIIAVSAGLYHTVGLKADGTVVAVGENGDTQCDVSKWSDIIAISTIFSHTVGLKADGTVVAVGNNGAGKCDVSKWKHIVAISAGGSHTIGLKADGTVVAVGYNDNEQCDVSKWSGIIAVSAGLYNSVGLKEDGTVVAVGANGTGQSDVSKWTDIIAVSAGGSHTAGVKADGTVVAVGNKEGGECDVMKWSNIAVKGTLNNK